MKLAIFDFDGTITSRDSLIDFLFFTHGRVKAFLNLVLLSPVIALYLARIIPNWKAKEIVLARFYKGMKKEAFNQLAIKFSENKLSHIVRPSAAEKIEWHKKEGHKVIVVSASMENYLLPWCEKRNIALIATKLRYTDDRVTGLIDGKNCYGNEKVKRIQETLNLKDFEHIYAYGDSKGDLPLQEIAHEFKFKPFKPEL